MAKLKNRENKLLFELALYSDPDSFDWITYKITISSIEDKNLHPLLNLSGPGLYLAYYKSEVLTMCRGILDVLDKKKTHFSFEPIDEKDFQLEVENRNNRILLSIYSRNFKVLQHYQWDYKSYLGIKMHVKKEDILNFVKQLKSEYEKIESKFPGKTLLPKSKKT